MPTSSSFITVKNALEQFAENHLVIKRFKTSFFEQIDNFSSADNTFPILYVIPSDVTFEQYTDRFFFRIYCVDVLQKDRSNESAILNDTLLTLRDLYNWLKIADNGLNVLSTARAIPINNFLVDYTAGWYLDVEVEGLAESNDCSIPFSDNFTLTGYTCDYTYATQFLTCETLQECQIIIDIIDEINNLTGGTANTFVTGGTFNSGSETLTLSRNDNQDVIITGFTSGSGSTGFDVFVTGGTYNNSNGIATFTNNTGGTFTVSGFNTSGGTEINTFVTGFTYDNNNNFIISQNNGEPDLIVNMTTVSGLTVNGTLSATTYLNLPLDVFITGGTYSNEILTLNRNDNQDIVITGFTSGSTGPDIFVTGGTYSNEILTLNRNDNQDVIISGFTSNPTPPLQAWITDTFDHTQLTINSIEYVPSVNKIYVAAGSNNVLIYDATTFEVLATVSVTQALKVRYIASINEVWCTSASVASIVRINATTNSVLTPITTDVLLGGTDILEFSSTKVFIAIPGNSVNTRIQVYNPSTLAIDASINTNVPTFVTGMVLNTNAASAQFNKIIVTGSGGIAIFNPTTNAIDTAVANPSSAISTGREIVYSPIEDKYYVASQGNNTVVCLNVDSASTFSVNKIKYNAFNVTSLQISDSEDLLIINQVPAAGTNLNTMCHFMRRSTFESLINVLTPSIGGGNSLAGPVRLDATNKRVFVAGRGTSRTIVTVKYL
jgi:hypothetical protein